MKNWSKDTRVQWLVSLAPLRKKMTMKATMRTSLAMEMPHRKRRVNLLLHHLHRHRANRWRSSVDPFRNMIPVRRRNRSNSIPCKVGERFIALFFVACQAWSVIAFYRYALLLLRKSEGEQRMSNQSQSDNDDDVRIKATSLLQQKNHKRRRWINRERERERQATLSPRFSSNDRLWL